MCTALWTWHAVISWVCEVHSRAASLSHIVHVRQGPVDLGCRGISGRAHETIQHILEEQGGPMVIRDMTSCTIHVRGRIEALRMHSLRDCTVIAGPVHGSAFVEGAHPSCCLQDAQLHRLPCQPGMSDILSPPRSELQRSPVSAFLALSVWEIKCKT